MPDAEKSALLADWSARLLAADGVDHVDASLLTVHENKFYADTAGTVTTQQRGAAASRCSPPCRWTTPAASSTPCAPSRRPPDAAGEYLTGTGWDWDAELARIPELLAEKMRAPSVEAGLYDLISRSVEPVADYPRVHRARD